MVSIDGCSHQGWTNLPFFHLGNVGVTLCSNQGLNLTRQLKMPCSIGLLLLPLMMQNFRAWSNSAVMLQVKFLSDSLLLYKQLWNASDVCKFLCVCTLLKLLLVFFFFGWKSSISYLDMIVMTFQIILRCYILGICKRVSVYIIVIWQGFYPKVALSCDVYLWIMEIGNKLFSHFYFL